jgi:hypothetical protein
LQWQELPLVVLPFQEKIAFFPSWLSVAVWAKKQKWKYIWIIYQF